MNRILIPLLVISASLIGCASQPANTSQDVTKTGDRYLTAEEVLEHISGNTEQWTKGAGYYDTDGSLIGVWEGDNVEGTWSVTDDGEVCVVVIAWGDEDCHRYQNKNEKVMMLYKGKSSFRETKAGNQLTAF